MSDADLHCSGPHRSVVTIDLITITKMRRHRDNIIERSPLQVTTVQHSISIYKPGTMDTTDKSIEHISHYSPHLHPYLLAYIFQFVPCSCCDTPDNQHICLVAIGDSRMSLAESITGGDARPTCEWQRTIVSLSTNTDHGPLHHLATRRPHSLLTHPDDKRTVLVFVARDGGALRFVSDRLRDDSAVVLVAVEQDGGALEYASPRLCDNDDVVLVAVKQNGYALEYVSTRLRDDKDTVLYAIRRNGCALQLASDRLRDDEEVVLAAIKQHFYAIMHASLRLRGIFS